MVGQAPDVSERDQAVATTTDANTTIPSGDSITMPPESDKYDISNAPDGTQINDDLFARFLERPGAIARLRASLAVQSDDDQDNKINIDEDDDNKSYFYQSSIPIVRFLQLEQQTSRLTNQLTEMVA